MSRQTAAGSALPTSVKALSPTNRAVCAIRVSASTVSRRGPRVSGTASSATTTPSLAASSASTSALTAPSWNGALGSGTSAPATPPYMAPAALPLRNRTSKLPGSAAAACISYAPLVVAFPPCEAMAMRSYASAAAWGLGSPPTAASSQTALH